MLEGNKDVQKESVDWSVHGGITVFSLGVRVGIMEKVTLELRLGRGEGESCGPTYGVRGGHSPGRGSIKEVSVTKVKQ